MIRPFVRILIAAASLAWAGCGVEPDPSASTATSELASASGSELAPAGAPSGELIQPRVSGCFECRADGVDIIELSWNTCVRICPGGSSNCRPMPCG